MEVLLPVPCTVTPDPGQIGVSCISLPHDVVHSVPTAPRTAGSENVSWGLGGLRMELRGKKQNWKGSPEPHHSPTLQGARLLRSALVLKGKLS